MAIVNKSAYDDHLERKNRKLYKNRTFKNKCL